MKAYAIFEMDGHRFPCLRAVFTDLNRVNRLCKSGVFGECVIVECETDTWPPIVNADNNAVDITFSTDNNSMTHVIEYHVDKDVKLPAVNVQTKTVTLSTESKAYKDFKYEQHYETLLKAAQKKFAKEA